MAFSGIIWRFWSITLKYLLIFFSRPPPSTLWTSLSKMQRVSMAAWKLKRKLNPKISVQSHKLFRKIQGNYYEIIFLISSLSKGFLIWFSNILELIIIHLRFVAENRPYICQTLSLWEFQAGYVDGSWRKIDPKFVRISSRKFGWFIAENRP